MTTWREELAWAAGFFDGEGSTYYHGRTETSSVVKLHVGQKDRRALDRFRAAVGIGVVYGPHKTGNHCDMYYFLVNSQEEVQAVVAMLWHWLGPVKRQQATSAFAKASAGRVAKAHNDAFCAHGHPFTPDNTRVYEWHGKKSRFCRACGRNRWLRSTKSTAQRLPTEAYLRLVG